ncbi:hypothetical protein ACHAWC_008974 [Mediolabrus comicus]
MKFIKKKKTAAAAEVSSSINSETDALAMSYNDDNTTTQKKSEESHVIYPPPTSAATTSTAEQQPDEEKSEISMTDSEKQRVEVVQKTSYISPMERKKRALERQKSLEVETAAAAAMTAQGGDGATATGATATGGGGNNTSSVSSSIARFNETFGKKKETKRSFGDSLTRKADAILHKKVEEPKQDDGDDEEEEDDDGSDVRDSILSTEIPPTLSAIEAAVSAPAGTAAQDPETSVPTADNDGAAEDAAAVAPAPVGASLLPPESDREKAKRAAIQQESSSGEEESSSGEYEETSEEEEDESEMTEPLMTVPGDKSIGKSTATGGDGSLLPSAAASVEKEKKDLESQLDEELENQRALELQHEQRQAEFRAEQERLRKVELDEAEKKRKLELERLQNLERQEEQRRAVEAEQRLLEEERLRLEGEQQVAESERRRRLEEEGQRALELIQRRLHDDREQQKALGRQQEERRQYEEQQRRLEEQQRRLQAEREHQQVLARQQEQMMQLQEEQRRLEEQRIRLEEEQRRLREERVRDQVQVSRAVGSADRTTTMGNTRPSPRSPANKTISASLPGGQRSRTYAPPRAAPVTSTPEPIGTPYDGVDDAELNWRLDSYAMLSDYTIVVKRALPGAHAPDFEVDDVNAIDFVMDSNAPKVDVYYVHKAMIAVGSRRSELLGRRIREAESTSRPDGHSSDVNVHETIMLESAADAMGIVFDFCYYHDKKLDINIHNAVPLVYLGKRYKIRALIDQSEEFVATHLESANAMHFLLDSYLFQLDDILSTAIDVTAAHLGETVDFNPIYRLPPQLFRRIILSKDLECDSELLSLIVYSYCGEHHAEDIDVEYLRELTKVRLMPDIDPKVALMLLKFYVELIFDDDEGCDIMDVLKGDSLMQRCIAVAAKHWQDEVYEPLLVDGEWDEKKQDPTALHRALPSNLQNYILEKCVIEAKHDFDKERATIEAHEKVKQAEIADVTKSFDKIVKDLKNQHSGKNQDKESLKKYLEEVETKVVELQAELEAQKERAESYKQELKRFRRVPGIHNFGEVSSKDPKIVDKTKCTYSANPEHHFPLHRRGDRPPTQMPRMTMEFENLAKENGYIYDDGHGDLLPVFYYVNK